MAVQLFFSRRCTVTAVLLASLAAGGCGQKSAQGGTDNGTSAAAAVPVTAADPAIQKIYDTTCRSCHAVPASGAPQAGDVRAWEPRVAQGRDVLIDHAINGYKGMPPMGMCPQCSEKEFAALIEMMSGASLK